MRGGESRGTVDDENTDLFDGTRLLVAIEGFLPALVCSQGDRVDMPNDVRLRILLDSFLDDFVSFWFLVETAEEETLHTQ